MDEGDPKGTQGSHSAQAETKSAHHPTLFLLWPFRRLPTTVLLSFSTLKRNSGPLGGNITPTGHAWAEIRDQTLSPHHQAIKEQVNRAGVEEAQPRQSQRAGPRGACLPLLPASSTLAAFDLTTHAHLCLSHTFSPEAPVDPSPIPWGARHPGGLDCWVLTLPLRPLRLGRTQTSPSKQPSGEDAGSKRGPAHCRRSTDPHHQFGSPALPGTVDHTHSP